MINCNLDKFDILRLKWKESLTGGDNYDLNDPYIKSAVESVTTKAYEVWNSLDKTNARSFLWEDLASTTTSEVITGNYLRIKDMALAYSMKGSELENNEGLLKDIISALDWMYENRYNERTEYYDNWWPWDIGGPLLLNDTVVLIYDKLSEKQITSYMNAIERFDKDPTKCNKEKREATGANRIDVSKVVAVRGVIVKDENKIKMAKDAIMQVFEGVEEGDGFYADGSFVQHGDIPYTCSYGAVLIEGLSVMLNFFKDSEWEMKDSVVNNLYTWVNESYQPLIYKGAGMDMVRGRGMSRNFLQDHTIGHGIIKSIALIAKNAPEPHGSNFRSMVKAWLTQDASLNFYKDRDIKSILIVKDIMNDERCIAKDELILHKNFANMDRVIHRAPGYALGLSMYSSRIQNYEYMNDENKKGLHTSDGMIYLYNDDLTQFSDDFWPTVNPCRMPGTTVENIEIVIPKERNCKANQTRSSKSWVGGTTLFGLYGIEGMDLESAIGDLEAKKSWFMFQNEIVALGTGIKATGNNIETIVENRKINKQGNNKLVINGREQAVDFGKVEKVDNIKYMYLEGNTEKSHMGYYFPGTTSLKVLRENREGAWREINDNADIPTEKVKNNYMTFWFDHGVNPVDEKYAYVILPNKSLEEVEMYSNKQEIEILENSSEVQAVKNTRLNILGANFWNDSIKKVDVITCNKKASVMLCEKDGELTIAVADPTMENKANIELEISKEVSEVISKDKEIEVIQLKPTLKLSVNVNKAKGKAFNAEFKVI